MDSFSSDRELMNPVDRTKILFQPNWASLQDGMGIASVEDASSPADYVSADIDPVLPNSKPMCQRSSFERGGGNTNAAAYSWNLAAYQQEDVAGQYPGPELRTAGQNFMMGHVREGMSTLAGTATVTNEIYGPRIPKMSGPPPNTDGDGSGTGADRRLPPMFGPKPTWQRTGAAAAAQPATTGSAAGSAGPAGSAGSAGGPIPSRVCLPLQTGTPGIDDNYGELDPTKQAALQKGLVPPPPTGFAVPPMAKTEPVPFLADFSKFFG